MLDANERVRLIKATDAQAKRRAPGMSRGACQQMCHDLTVALGGNWADKRTRSYSMMVRVLWAICLQAQTPEVRAGWDAEELQPYHERQRQAREQALENNGQRQLKAA